MIAAYVGAIFIIIAFSQLLIWFGLVEKAKQIGGISKQTASVLSDASLDDDTKEKAMRQNSIALFGGFFSLTAGLIAALGLPILAVWLVSFAHVWSFETVMTVSLSWPVIVGGLVIFIVMMMRARGGVQE